MISFMEKLRFFRRIVKTGAEEKYQQRQADLQNRFVALQAKLAEQVASAQAEQAAKVAASAAGAKERQLRAAREDLRQAKLARYGALEHDLLQSLELSLQAQLRSPAYLDLIARTAAAETTPIVAVRAQTELAPLVAERLAQPCQSVADLSGVELILAGNTVLNLTVPALFASLRPRAVALLQERLRAAEAAAEGEV